MISDSLQARLLKASRRIQPPLLIKPESDPGLQILGGPVFTLRRQPGDFKIHLVGTEQRRATPATKANQHAGLGQFPHGRLGNRRACSQQDGRRVRDRNVPIVGFTPRLGDVLHSATIDQHPAPFQVIKVCPLRVQNALERRWREFVHQLSTEQLTLRTILWRTRSRTSHRAWE